MLRILEFLTNFYWIILPQTILESLWHSDWRRARRQGVWGIVSEVIQAVLLTNSVQFYAPNDGPWDMATVHAILRKAHIPAFGVVFAHGDFSFRVPGRYAWLAEKKLADAGVPFSYDPQPVRNRLSNGSQNKL